MLKPDCPIHYSADTSTTVVVTFSMLCMHSLGQPCQMQTVPFDEHFSVAGQMNLSLLLVVMPSSAACIEQHACSDETLFCTMAMLVLVAGHL